jgi:hypothetical protein
MRLRTVISAGLWAEMFDPIRTWYVSVYQRGAGNKDWGTTETSSCDNAFECSDAKITASGDVSLPTFWLAMLLSPWMGRLLLPHDGSGPMSPKCELVGVLPIYIDKFNQ